MQNYGYRSITTTVPGIAGSIERGSVARQQRKGDRFILTSPVRIILNRVDGQQSHITVLDSDGRAMARLNADTALY